jgi:hypothetical protein
MASARLEIIDHICEAGTRHNDDIWGATATAAWIMDGATGLSTKRIFPHAPSDAAWFAASIDGCLRGANWSRGASDCLRDAVSAVEAKFHREAIDAPPDMSLWPSGAITIVAATERTVQVVNLGDCKLLFRNLKVGTTRTFGTSAVTALDQMLVEAIVRLQSQGIVEPAALWSRLAPEIRRNRARMNRPDGYWSLDVTGRGLNHMEELLIVPGEMNDFLLVTDGFYRLVDCYRAYSDEALLDAALSRGLTELYRQLRAIEAQDASCGKYPRLKPRDDATAVLGRVVEDA